MKKSASKTSKKQMVSMVSRASEYNVQGGMGCFLIGVTGEGFSKSGEALLGSVSDDPYDVRTFLRRISPKDLIPHIGTELVSTTEHTLTERGYFANPDETTRGVNAEGVAFTCAMVIEDERKKSDRVAIPYVEVTTAIMRSSRNVDEAIALFEEAGAVTPAYSVLIADADGNLAHLEVGSYGIKVYKKFSKKNPGAVFAVNCYLSKKFAEYNAPSTLIQNVDNNNSFRRERGQEFVAQFKEGLDVAALTNLLSDHKNRDKDPRDNPILEAWGYSICNHGTRKSDEYPYEKLPWGTVSAEILQPAKKTFWYCYGWPCGESPEYGDQIFQEKSWGKFVPFGLDNDSQSTEETVPLTTVDGSITEAGKIFL